MKLNDTIIEFKNVKESESGYVSYLYFIKNLQGDEIGSCALRVFDPESEKINVLGNIGYEIDPEHRGRGHAKNAAKMLLSEARALGLSNALICCDADNLPSVAVCRAIGAEKAFEFEKNGKTALAFLKNLEGIEK